MSHLMTIEIRICVKPRPTYVTFLILLLHMHVLQMVIPQTFRHVNFPANRAAMLGFLQTVFLHQMQHPQMLLEVPLPAERTRKTQFSLKLNVMNLNLMLPLIHLRRKFNLTLITLQRPVRAGLVQIQINQIREPGAANVTHLLLKVLIHVDIQMSEHRERLRTNLALEIVRVQSKRH